MNSQGNTESKRSQSLESRVRLQKQDKVKYAPCTIYGTNCKVIKNYSLHVSYDTYTICKVSNAFPLRKQFFLCIVFIIFSFTDHQVQKTTICTKAETFEASNNQTLFVECGMFKHDSWLFCKH